MKPTNSYAEFSLVTVAFGILFALTIPACGQGLPDDWTHHHVVFSNPGSFEQAMKSGSFEDWYRVESDPRFILQQRKRSAAARGLGPVDKGRAEEIAGISSAQANTRNKKKSSLQRDWNQSLGTGGVAATMYPAKFTFDVNGTAGCTDFAVFGVNAVGVSGGQANIVGITNLYSGSSPTGLCGSNPTVRFGYFVGTGRVQTSPVLSLDGTKIAFVESITNGSKLHVVKLGTTGSNGTAAVSVAPGAGNNATDTAIVLSGSRSDTRSSVYVDYSTDSAYVGDDSGILHKFTPVFTGTLAEVTTGGWPVTVAASTILTGPTYDSVSQNVFIGSSNGNLYYVRASGSSSGTCASGSPPCLGTPSRAVGDGSATVGGVVDPPVVDSTIYAGSTRGHVFATAASDGSTNCEGFLSAPCMVVVQADTILTLTGSVQLGNAPNNHGAHSGTFDDMYFNSISSGHMYVGGTNATSFLGGTATTLWRVNFTSAGVMTGGTKGPTLTSSNNVDYSPLTEIKNGATDWLFLSVAGSGSPAACGGNACVMNFDITSSFPAASTAAVQESGGTSAIIIDNVSGSAQASSIYFGTLSSPRNAVKLTQSGLL